MTKFQKLIKKINEDPAFIGEVKNWGDVTDNYNDGSITDLLWSIKDDEVACDVAELIIEEYDVTYSSMEVMDCEGVATWPGADWNPRPLIEGIIEARKKSIKFKQHKKEKGNKYKNREKVIPIGIPERKTPASEATIKTNTAEVLVKAIFNKFYKRPKDFETLFCIEAVLQDHGVIEKRWQHTAFLRQMVLWECLDALDKKQEKSYRTRLSQLKTGLGIDHQYPYKKWGGDNQILKETCKIIALELGKEYPYKWVEEDD